MTPTPFSDPLMQAVFDALDAFIAGTGYISATAGVTLDGSGVTHSMNRNNGKGASDTYTTRAQGVTVAVNPPAATLGPGATQQFAATATDADGAPQPGAAFLWAVTGGALGTVDANGLYTAPAVIDVASVVSVSATLVGGLSWASASVSLIP